MPAKAVFSVAVAGWCEVFVNGAKVGKDVLSPVACQSDRRISTLDFDVGSLLKVGTNVVEVLLGNGWQNTFTIDTWGFCDAPWRSCPKICGKMKCDGRSLFVNPRGLSPAEGGADCQNRVEWRAGRFKAWAERRRDDVAS